MRVPTRSTATAFDATALRAAREARGVSRAVLADMVGVDVETVRLWETGQGAPAPGRLQRVAGAVGLAVEDLHDSAAGSATLADLRRRAGLTQTALGQRLGVSAAVVSHWEQGKRSVPSELAADYATLLGVHASYFHRAPRAVGEVSADPGCGEMVDGDTFIHLARLALAGDQSDIAMYIRRQAYRLRSRCPQTAEALEALTEKLPTPTPLRR